MTIKIDRKPTALHLLVVLDKNKGVQATGMIDPKNMGKTDATGTVVAVGNGAGLFYEGLKIYLPVSQQKDTFIYEGNTFCTVHYSYVTLLMVDEYTVEI